MDNKEDFSQFRRQSQKGILVIYINILYKASESFLVPTISIHSKIF